MVKKRTILVLMTSALVLVLAACGQKESQTGKGIKVVTSFYPIYAMVKEV